VGRPERKRQLGRRRRRWEYNNVWILRKSVGSGADWIDLSENREQDARYCKRGNELLGSIKCGDFLD
jgi:hypothetical protein